VHDETHVYMTYLFKCEIIHTGHDSFTRDTHHSHTNAHKQARLPCKTTLIISPHGIFARAHIHEHTLSHTLHTHTNIQTGALAVQNDSDDSPTQYLRAGDIIGDMELCGMRTRNSAGAHYIHARSSFFIKNKILLTTHAHQQSVTHAHIIGNVESCAALRDATLLVCITYVCACTHTHTHTRTHTRAHTCAQALSRTHTSLEIWSCVGCGHATQLACIQLTIKHACAYTYTHARARAHACAHTHMHTHTHTSLEIWSCVACGHATQLVRSADCARKHTHTHTHTHTHIRMDEHSLSLIQTPLKI